MTQYGSHLLPQLFHILWNVGVLQCVSRSFNSRFKAEVNNGDVCVGGLSSFSPRPPVAAACHTHFHFQIFVSAWLWKLEVHRFGGLTSLPHRLFVSSGMWRSCFLSSFNAPSFSLLPPSGRVRLLLIGSPSCQSFPGFVCPAVRLSCSLYLCLS